VPTAPYLFASLLTLHHIGQLDNFGVRLLTTLPLATRVMKLPQHELRTREKLEQALGAAPQDVVKAEEEGVSIAGLGALIDFDPYDDALLPTVSGVYVFYDRTDRPVYVGRTKRTIDVRVREHTDKFWFKKPIVDAGRYLQITDESFCKQTEQVLIKFMRSPLLLNRQGVEAELEDDRGEAK